MHGTLMMYGLSITRQLRRACSPSGLRLRACGTSFRCILMLVLKCRRRLGQEVQEKRATFLTSLPTLLGRHPVVHKLRIAHSGFCNIYLCSCWKQSFFRFHVRPVLSQKFSNRPHSVVSPAPWKQHAAMIRQQTPRFSRLLDHRAGPPYLAVCSSSPMAA